MKNHYALMTRKTNLQSIITTVQKQAIPAVNAELQQATTNLQSLKQQEQQDQEALANVDAQLVMLTNDAAVKQLRISVLKSNLQVLQEETGILEQEKAIQEFKTSAKSFDIDNLTQMKEQAERAINDTNARFVFKCVINL